MERIFLLKLENGSSLEARAPIDLDLAPNDMCVFARDFYTDIGEVRRELDPTKLTAPTATLPLIQKVAENSELATANGNAEKARNATNIAQTLIEQLKLEMKLVNAHCSLDGKLMTFQFSADGRVDFRELVKELSRALSTRIELRQIGVRDETGIYGGIAVCGQTLCCCRFLKEFNSINVKMAKEQDLSLTPATISGVCGRLKCCLKFEHSSYLELAKGMPRKGEMCETPSGNGKIIDRNLLTRKVSVSLENGNISQFSVDEVKPLGGERKCGNGNPNCPKQRSHQERNNANSNHNSGENRNERDKNRQSERGRENRNAEGSGSESKS